MTRYGLLRVTDALVSTRQKVEILDVRGDRVRIRAIEATRIAVGEPWLKPRAEAVVATASVELLDEESPA